MFRTYLGEVGHFAYPYGRFADFPHGYGSLVFGAGFKSCASAERGCHITDGCSIHPQELLIRRDHIILNWPIKHIEYFLLRNSARATFRNNYYQV
jgi:hypothetical protein